MLEKWDWFIREARNIISEAEKRGIILRIMGAIAIKLHCPRYSSLLQNLNRIPTDLDFVGYLRQRDEVDDMFKELRFSSRFRDFAYGDRRVYIHPERNIAVDVFFDELRMCHTVNFKGRLELDSPTITLADLLMEKAQIVKINEKDIKDCIVLLREHKIGDTDDETINAKYIASVLAKNWGYYYTVTSNLKQIKDVFASLFISLSNNDREDINKKILNLLEIIDNEPKSLKWKMRAKVGMKVKWYEEVEELHHSV